MRLKKIVQIGFLILGLGLSSLFLGVWLGQDRLVALFVQEANRYLRTPVRVGQIRLSLLDQFPRVSVSLQDVVVSGSLAQDTVPLARARSLYCAFDAWDLLVGQYRIRAVTVTDGRVHVVHDAQGRPNYDILRLDSTDTDDSPVVFAVENIRVKRVAAIYDDQARQQRVAGQTADLRATLQVNGNLVTIRAQGGTQVQAIYLGSDAYARDKQLTLQTTFVVDRLKRRLTLSPSEIRIGPAAYRVAGTIDYATATNLELRVEGQRTDVQSLVALLPPRLGQQFAGYQSQGDVYFRGTVRGELSARANPRVDVQFGCRDASFYHPAYGETLAHVFATGSITNGVRHDLRTAELLVQRVRGTLHNRAFSGNVRYTDFTDPTLLLDLRADLDVARALRFFPVAAVRSGSGTAQATLKFAGNLRQFRQHPNTTGQASGELRLHNVGLRLRDYTQPLTGLSGAFRLRGNEVAVTGLAGRLGHSDFQLSGVLRNALGWLLGPNQQLAATVDFKARQLDFDELLRIRGAGAPAGRPGPAQPAAYTFRLAPTLALDLNATVQRVRFRRFRGHDLRGTFRLRGQVLSSRNLSIAALGGQASGQGVLDARQPDLLKISSTTSCTRLPLDSLFYVFEDFGQRFITARHLRGTLTATAESDVYFDRHLTPLTNRVEAEIKATVRDGELNNFEPLQKLSMLASREKLRHLRFAELTNNFYIQSRTVYLPEMEIRSNVRIGSLIRVTGTHTFDQRMDYHLTIPILPGLFRRPSDALGTSGPNLLLAVQGTENDFHVSYDRVRGGRPAGGPTTAGRPSLPDQPAARPDPLAAPPAAPRRLFEVRKPAEKKSTQPQPGDYFNF